MKQENEYIDSAVALDDGEALVAFGGALKALGEGKVGGYLVVFSDENTPDLTNDYFTKDTAFGIESGDSLPVYYAHGTDPAIKRKRIGRGTVQVDDDGLWFETQLALADAYEKRIYELAEMGKLGYSSGAAGHLVERRMSGNAKQITQWVIAEASLTPEPAEPRTRGIIPIKSLVIPGDNTPEEEAQPEATPEASASDAVEAAQAQPEGEATQPDNATPILEIREMSEEQKTVETTVIETQSAEIKALSAKIDSMLKAMEETPAVRKSGYYTNDGGTADPSIKSVGDLLMAIRRGDEKRLTHVYGAVKTLTGEHGSSGGFVLPSSFSTELLSITPQTSPILSRVNRIMVDTTSGEYPVLDIYSPLGAGSGQDARAGGMRGRARAEASAYTETEPRFEQLVYRINDSASGYVQVSREQSNDAPFMEGVLRDAINVSVNAKLERDILLGTGVGEPLGILTNTAGLVDVTPVTNDVFAYADATNMLSRYQARQGRTVWMAHQSILPDVYAFQTNPSGGTQAVTDVQRGDVMNILGFPLIYSQHLPLANASGCVVLADLSAYLLFTRGDLYIEFSEHVGFLTGVNTWRFGLRCDGKPMNRGVISQANPGTAHTVSHFVRFND